MMMMVMMSQSITCSGRFSMFHLWQGDGTQKKVPACVLDALWDEPAPCLGPHMKLSVRLTSGLPEGCRKNCRFLIACEVGTCGLKVDGRN